MRKFLRYEKIFTPVPLEKQSAKPSSIWQGLARLMQRILNGSTIQPHFPYRQILFSFLGGFFGLWFLPISLLRVAIP